MPDPDDQREEALHRLDEGLDAFEARRARAQPSFQAASAGEGYTFLAQIVGGVLGGLGLGWFIDRLAHTSPAGLIGGLLIGTGFSVFAAVQGARRMSAAASAKSGPLPSVPFDDDDD